MDILDAVYILDSNYKGDHHHDTWIQETLCNKECNIVGLYHYFFDSEKLQMFVHDHRVISLFHDYDINIRK